MCDITTGFTTHRIACEEPTLLAGIAIHSGSHGDYDGNYQNSPWKECSASSGPVPAIGFHGDQDVTVPFNGGRNPSPLSSAEWGSFAETMDVWGTQNSCNDSTTVTFRESGKTISQTTYQGPGCAAVGYVIHEMGHEWWSGSTTRIISFFQNHGIYYLNIYIYIYIRILNYYSFFILFEYISIRVGDS